VYRQKGYKEDYYYFLMEFRRLGKIREWKVVGRNREANGESGSAQVEERLCAGRRRKRRKKKKKKKKKDRISWVCREKGGVFCCFFFSFEFKTRNSV